MAAFTAAVVDAAPATDELLNLVPSPEGIGGLGWSAVPTVVADTDGAAGTMAEVVTSWGGTGTTTALFIGRAGIAPFSTNSGANGFPVTPGDVYSFRVRVKVIGWDTSGGGVPSNTTLRVRTFDAAGTALTTDVAYSAPGVWAPGAIVDLFGSYTVPAGVAYIALMPFFNRTSAGSTITGPSSITFRVSRAIMVRGPQVPTLAQWQAPAWTFLGAANASSSTLFNGKRTASTKRPIVDHAPAVDDGPINRVANPRPVGTAGWRQQNGMPADTRLGGVQTALRTVAASNVNTGSAFTYPDYVAVTPGERVVFHGRTLIDSDPGGRVSQVSVQAEFYDENFVSINATAGTPSGGENLVVSPVAGVIYELQTSAIAVAGAAYAALRFRFAFNAGTTAIDVRHGMATVAKLETGWLAGPVIGGYNGASWAGTPDASTSSYGPSPSRTSSTSRATSDTAGAADSTARNLALVRTVLDAAPATDAPTRTLIAARRVTDTAPATDAVIVELSALRIPPAHAIGAAAAARIVPPATPAHIRRP